MFLTLKSNTSNSVAVLLALVKDLQIPITTFTVKTDLENHPEYPSLLALSDCLTNWKIPHVSYRIDQQDFNSEDLSYPFIAHLHETGGRFILISEIKNNLVKYTDEKGKYQTCKEHDFLKKWDGIGLFAQKAKESGETNYIHTLIKDCLYRLRTPFLIAVVLASVFLGISYSIPFLLLVILKLTGITVSILLLIHSVNTNNPFIQNLCSLGKQNECNAILKSDAAKITSWLTWSEVGMFYFAGSFTCLILSPTNVVLLTWMNLACLPYTFYSIGYQIRQKKWCILCCSVQVLLWLEAFVFIFNYPPTQFSFTLAEWMAIVLCFLLPISIWVVLKPLLQKSEQINPLKQQLKKFKYNSVLFNQLLINQQRYFVSDDLMPITFGNQDAETIITMVSNPFCGPCATTHKILDEWLETRKDIQLKVVFTTANEDNDVRTKVARHISALSLLDDKRIVKEALNEWYSQSTKKYETWAEQYPVSFNNKINEVTQRQKVWCEMAEIQSTPTILINGYKLIDPYRLEDIKYLLS